MQISPWASPIRVDAHGVHLCTLNLTVPVPFFSNLMEMGDCASRALPPVPLSELMRLLDQETPEDYWSSPRGFVVHGGRVGSTALANMLGSLPDVVALKEPEAFTDLLLSAAPSADGDSSSSDEAEAAAGVGLDRHVGEGRIGHAVELDARNVGSCEIRHGRVFNGHVERVSHFHSDATVNEHHTQKLGVLQR